MYDVLGARHVAEIGERIAEQRGVAGLDRGIPRRALEACFEEVRRFACPADGRVHAGKVAVDVDALVRHEGLVGERVFEEADGGRQVVSPLPDRRRSDTGAECSRAVRRDRRLCEQLENQRLGAVSVAEADCQLEVGEPELPRLGRVELRPRLEEVCGDAELRGQLPEGLYRGLPRPGLDARDVGVRDSRSGQLALREPLRQPQALEALPDGLARNLRGLGHHRLDSYVLVAGRQWAAPSCSVVIVVLSRVTRKEGNPMLRRMLSVRLALLLAALAVVALLAAEAPWGPA